MDTGCSLEDLPGAIDDMGKERERERERGKERERERERGGRKREFGKSVLAARLDDDIYVQL